jgi:hypothetical protein
MKKTDAICYLCGQPLQGEIDDDHVPPKQFYAKSLRKLHNPDDLLTLPVHKSCNISYQKDEDYFVHSIAPLAMESYPGKAIFEDISNQFKRPQGKRIGEMIRKEFDDRPSGLILPAGKVVKRFSGDRIWRVVWKIVRGLFFHEYGRFLPENTPRVFDNVSVGDRPPEKFVPILASPPRGKYPAVFDYKFICVPELNNFHAWAMLFWDRLIKFACFHDPNCQCDLCTKHSDAEK